MLCTKTPTAFTKVATGAALSLALTAAACGDDESSSPSAAAGAAGMDSSGTGGETAMDGSDTGGDAGSSPGAAGSAPDSPIHTIVDVAAGDDRFETLVQAITDAGLVDALSADGPFTVFAPTDDAFDSLPEGLLESLDTDTLGNILRYHVVSGAVESSEAVTLDEASTLLDGENLTLSTEGDRLYLNGLTLVVSADIAADNGVIHVIDSVLVPGAFPGTIADLVATYPRLSTLAGAVPDSIASVLACDSDSCPDGITLLAPVDSAFEGVEVPSNEDDLTALLLYHALEAEAPSETVASLASTKTANGAYLAIRSDGGVKLNDGSKDVNVIYTDIETSNGVVHLLDGVLVPPGNIVEVASAVGGFSSLLTAAGAANVPGTSSTFAAALTGEGPFTVLAPTDDAFSALPEAGFGDDLASVLGAHAFAAAVDSAAVVAAIEAGGQSPPTLTDASDNVLELSVVGDSIMINSMVKIAATDIPASNGMIHVIDSVIVPKDVMFPGTIVEALSAYPAFSKLVDAAVNADAGVLEALSGDGPWTLFAPFDPAFEGIDTSQNLTNVLLYHALSGAYAEADVAAAFAEPGTIETAEGSTITVDATSSQVNESNLIRTDLRADNGIIHVIDAVLMPE